MSPSTILMILKAIQILQAMKKDEQSTEKINNLVNDAVDGTDSEKLQIAAQITKIDPAFLGDIADGLGDFIRRVLGKK